MQEQKIWHSGILGMSFSAEEGRILIFRKTLEVLGKPSHYRFLYNASTHEIAVQACKPGEAGSHRVGKLDETNSCDIKSIAFVRMIYKDAGWNKRWSYWLTGRAFPAQRLVSFQIEDAAPIENGRVMPGNVSPTVALCRAESFPAQNNPTSPVKCDSGAV